MFEYRLRFSKEKNLKFLSHLELLRTMERAFRRSHLPLSYSEGFHPHPKMSFGPALAVGVSSSDEYLDFHLNKDLDSQQIKEALNKGLPEGLRVLDVGIIKHPKPLNAFINRASYSIFIKTVSEEQGKVSQWLNNLPNLPELIVNRFSKDGQKIVNIRPWLHNLTTEMIHEDTIEIRFTGEIGSGGNLRPDDITGIIPFPIEVMYTTRIGLWHEEKGVITKPMDLTC